jgi:peptide subunit release factor 1 (eRF1)
LDSDAERFFRVVANNIGENYSKPTGWPLILAALTEHHHLFQQVNKNPLLLPKGITVNPAAISVEKLATQAWEIMQPEYDMKLNQLAEQFMQAKANGKGSDDMKEVAQAAVEGRVDTLLVEADRIIAVRITNLVTGNTQNKDLNNPRVDDLLDDMGELVMQMGGKVMVIPPEKMPSETGLAAIFRY